MQEDPHYTFVPAGSSEEVKMVLLPNFLWEISQGGTKSPQVVCGLGSDSDGGCCKSMADIPPGQSLIGHPVEMHESAVLGAPPEHVQAETVKDMHELGTEWLIKERGVLGLHRASEPWISKNVPAQKDQVLWLLQGSPRYRQSLPG